MRIVNLEQNSPDWFVWRNFGLGASEAAAVLGVSPWATPFELWTAKAGICPPEKPNVYAQAAMDRGHRLEAAARERAERQSGLKLPPVSGMHDVFDYIRASLDGYDPETRTLLEIKCPGKADHGKALKGQIPEKYMLQMQQQFLVSGAVRGLYFSWDGVSDDGVMIEVLPDSETMQKIHAALTKFWDMVVLEIPPPMTHKDLITFSKRSIQEAENVAKASAQADAVARALDLVVKNSREWKDAA